MLQKTIILKGLQDKILTDITLPTYPFLTKNIDKQSISTSKVNKVLFLL